MEQTLKYAPDVWKLLNGIACIYKPSLVSAKAAAATLRVNICNDLNGMRTRPPQTIVELQRLGPGEQVPAKGGVKVVATVPDGNESIAVIEKPSWADHINVIGPRYIPEDIRYKIVNRLGYKFSGVTLVGINEGCRDAAKISASRWLRVHHVTGIFGIGTESYFDDGRVMEKATFHKIRAPMLERILDTFQHSHQRHMFQSAGVNLDTEQAYKLASSGLVRPSSMTEPMVYSMRLLDFDLPKFTIEMKCINETDDHLANIVHQLGLKLRSVAACTKIHCVKYGPFELEHALLRKHWNVENVIENMLENKKILANFDLNYRDPMVRGKAQDSNVVDTEETTRRRPTEPEYLQTFS